MLPNKNGDVFGGIDWGIGSHVMDQFVEQHEGEFLVYTCKACSTPTRFTGLEFPLITITMAKHRCVPNEILVMNLVRGMASSRCPEVRVDVEKFIDFCNSMQPIKGWEVAIQYVSKNDGTLDHTRIVITAKDFTVNLRGYTDLNTVVVDNLALKSMGGKDDMFDALKYAASQFDNRKQRRSRSPFPGEPQKISKQVMAQHSQRPGRRR